MKYTINKDILKNMVGFEEDKLSVISPNDYNNILYSTELTEMDDSRIEVGIKFIIRSAYSNKIVVFEDTPIIDLDLIEPKVEGVNGYFQVMHTLDLFLRSKGKVEPNLMSRTHLMTLGVHYSSEDNKIYHIMNLVVLEDDIQEFLDMFIFTYGEWKKIVDLISSTSTGKFDKILLSQLPLVK